MKRLIINRNTEKTAMVLWLCGMIAFPFAQQGQRIYELDEIPIVDVHTHYTDWDECVNIMEGWGGTISVTLSGTSGHVNEMDYIENNLDGRILICPRANGGPDGLGWSESDIQGFADDGFVGVKIWHQYNDPPVSEMPDIDSVLSKLGEVGLPAIGFHIADPPELHYHVPDKYMVYQQDMEKVIASHPATTFIMAHMFWLSCNDTSLDTLAMFFDRNPNLYADISASFEYWNAPNPDYDKTRQFLIDYKDRLLFASDWSEGIAAGTWNSLRELLETDNVLDIFWGRTGDDPSQELAGLELPLDVLNHIYYWNASRLIPGVKDRLMNLGYELSDYPPGYEPVALKNPAAQERGWQILCGQRIFFTDLSGRYHASEVIYPQMTGGFELNYLSPDMQVLIHNGRVLLAY
ncbi:amidohydrolase family protein [Fibrobacterota bacterium]